TEEVTVNVVPDTATLNVGQTRQLVAVVVGSTNQAVTWSTSAANFATVSATGLVTAVAAGTAVITAVSQADATARDAAVINVVVPIPPAPPTIVITSVTQGGTNQPVNTQNVNGQIDVTAELTVPTGATVQRVEFLLDNAVLANCTQTFTSGGSTDEEIDQSQIPLVCSINTADFNAATGVPAFPNGPHTISARVISPSGTVTASTSHQLIFNNPSFINAAVAFLAPGTSTAKPCLTSGANARSQGGPGTLWCGGDVRVTLTPVNFAGSTGAIASATVNLNTSGVGVSGATGCRTTGNRGTDPTIAGNDGGAGPGGAINFPGCPVTTVSLTDATPADGLIFTFSAGSQPTAGVLNLEDLVNFVVNSTTTAGQAGPVCINPTATNNPLGVCGTGAGGGSNANAAFFLNPIRVDNLAPRITLFDLRPNTCDQPSCYLNGSFAFAAGTTGFFTSVDYGVDSQNSSSFFEAGTSATALSAVTSVAPLANTATNADMFLRASARDTLGNVRQVFPTSDSTIVTTTAASAQKFGVDKVSPFIVSAVTPTNNGATLPVFSYIITAADTATPPAGPSGINLPGTGPFEGIVVRAEELTPAGTVCLDPDAGARTTISCTTGGNQGNGTEAVGNGVNFTLGIAPAGANAYFRVAYFARDRANNPTATTTVLNLFDNIAPGMGAVVTPSIITGNASAGFATTATDNLDLGDVASYIQYGPPGVGIASFIQDVATPVSLGAYGPAEFTTTATATSTIPNFLRSIQVGPAGVFNRASSVTFNVRDQAGVANNNVCPATGAPNTSLANCTSRRDDITVAVAAGIGASNPETPFSAVAGFGTFATGVPSNTTVCNGTTQPAGPAPQPCPTNPTSTVITASVNGASATFQANPFVRVNFYYTGPATNGRSVLIGSGAQTATQDDGT
ncbi:MAG: Ig-like domain-containing protein, partial [Longimicrobiales bacterium]